MRDFRRKLTMRLRWHLRHGRLRWLRRRLKFVHGKRAAVFWRRTQSIAVIMALITSLLVPAMFSGLFGGHAHAFSGSQGPRTATASGDCTDTGTGGTIGWGGTAGNAFSNDSTYATLAINATTNYLKCTNFGFTIPSGVVIAGIVVTIERSCSNTGCTDNDVLLTKNGTTTVGTDRATGTDYPSTDTFENHGGTSDPWGTSWTPSEINASTFGVFYNAVKGGNPSRTLNVDVISITVHYTFDPDFDQSSYRWFANEDSATVTTPLDGQDTPTTAPALGTPFRLRTTIHVSSEPALSGAGIAFKLQYAAVGGDGLCDATFTDESYADVTTLTPISYYNNASVSDGATVGADASGDDPVHGTDTPNILQDYNEANNANVVTTILAGQDGLWDFTLVTNNAPTATTYCLRLVTSGGSTFSSLGGSYSVIPTITTPVPGINQTNYRWFNGQDAVPNNTFLQTVGGANNDFGNSIVQTSDGGYIVTGETTSFGVTGKDLLLTKFDNSGTEQWTKTLGGSGDDIGYSLIQIPDGGYVVTGSTTSFGVTGKDLLLTKFDNSGTEQWTKTLGGSGDEEGKSVVRTADGGYVVTGSTTTYDTNGDVWLAKFDNSGTEQWTKTLGGAGVDAGNDVVQTADGGYAVAGTFGGGLLLAKFSSSGEEQWTKTLFGGSAESLVQTADGGYIMTGSTTAYGMGGNEIWVSKFDSTGTEQWTKILQQDLLDDYGYDIVRTTDGGYAVSASITLYPGGETYIWLIKLDDSGEEQWTTAVSGSIARSLVQTTDGGYAAAGSFGTDVWVLKFDSSGSIDACSTLCTVAGPDAVDESVTEANQTLTEVDRSLAEAGQSPTVADQTSSTTTTVQAGHTSFGVTLGETGSDVGRSVLQTSDGGYVVAAITNSYGVTGTDILLTKFSGNGTELWTKTAGGAGNEGILNQVAMTTTNTGGFAVLTNTTSYGSTGNNTLIVEFNSSGVEVISKLVDLPSTFNPTSFVRTSDGGYIITGLSNAYATDGYLVVVKLDILGAVEWLITTGGGFSIDTGQSIVETSDGGYAITGTYGYFSGDTSLWLLKLNSGGAIEWTKTIGGAGIVDSGRSLAQTSDGGYIVTGITDTYTSGGGQDLWLVKFDSSGTEQWTKTLGGSGTDQGLSVIQTADGGYAVTGSTTAFDSSGDLWLIKFDSAGIEQWTKTIGESGTADVGYSVIQTSDGGYAVAGSTQSYGAGGNDLLLVKFGASGETPGCSSGCTFQSVTEVDTAVSVADLLSLPFAHFASSTFPSITEATETAAEDYFMDNGLWTESAALPSIPLGAQDVVGMSLRHDNPLRLRFVLEATGAVSTSSLSLKLQVAPQVGGTCDLDFMGGESYVDIGPSAPFDYYDNSNLADGDWAQVGGDDPSVSGTLRHESYQEAAGFTNRHGVTSGYLLWDVSLTPTDDAVYGNYCFRVVKSDDTPLDTYDLMVELTLPPASSQQMRHGKFFDTTAGTRQPIYW